MGRDATGFWVVLQSFCSKGVSLLSLYAIEFVFGRNMAVGFAEIWFKTPNALKCLKNT